MQLNRSFLCTAVPETTIVSGILPERALFSVDSRTLVRGEIFVALAGEMHDGHDFLVQAIRNGASAVLIASEKQHSFLAIPHEMRNAVCCIVVDDPLKALVAYAHAWRMQFSVPIIGVTGSVGKTSTKERIGILLKTAGKNYYISQGNQNTLLGIALNLLRMDGTHEGAVFEVGISKRGEMCLLANLLRPTIAVITSIGHGHMAGIGNITDIAAEKRAICTYFNAENIAIINGDQQLLATVSYKHPVIKFGCKITNQIQARKITLTSDGMKFLFKLYQRRYAVCTRNALHKGAVYNALAAAAVAQLLNIPDDVIIKGMEQPLVVKKRFELINVPDSQTVFIDDSYNANPESMKLALTALHTMNTTVPKIAVLGDMLELGINTAFWHRQLGRFLRKIPSITQLILVGEHMRVVSKTAPLTVTMVFVKDWQEAAKVLHNYLVKEDLVVLLKGSNAMGMGNIITAVQNNQKEQHG